MAKTYEELEKLGWFCPSGNLGIWHHGNKMQIRTSSESDAEFRERLERATPNHKIEASAKERLLEAKDALKRAEEELSYWQERFKEESLWDLQLGNLNQPHLNLKGITWSEVLTHIQNPVYEISAENWSGDDVWLVHFYKGTKRRPHDLHIGMATRVGWQEKGEKS